MVLDMIDVNASVDYRANEAAITQIVACDDSPTEWAAMLAALAII